MWTIGRLTKTVSDVTIGTAIVIVHVAMADRLELRRRMARKPDESKLQASDAAMT
jgi:hypothetical protein